MLGRVEFGTVDAEPLLFVCVDVELKRSGVILRMCTDKCRALERKVERLSFASAPVSIADEPVVEENGSNEITSSLLLLLIEPKRVLVNSNCR